MRVGSYEQIREHLLEEMRRACTAYRESVDYDTAVAFGRMIGIRTAAGVCLAAGPFDPLYEELNEMVEAARPHQAGIGGVNGPH